MEDDFESWKKRQIENKFQYWLDYYKKNTIALGEYLHDQCCACCGLTLGQREYPKGVDISVDPVPWNDLTTENSFIQRDQIRLESGDWLKMSFFIPDIIDYNDEYEYSEIAQQSQTNKLGQIQLSSLIGIAKHNNWSTWYDVYNGVKYVLGLDGKQFVKEYFNVLKGKQFICIEPKSYKEYYGYSDWIDHVGMTGLIERQYSSPWFHNSPYPPESEDGLNYLQLQLCKVL